MSFKWSENLILALGVYFSYDKVKSYKCNFDEKLDKLEKTLNIWRSRDLTILGRINIAISLALSKLIHIAPRGLRTEGKHPNLQFYMERQTTKDKKSTLIGERKAGVLKAHDFIEVTKASKLAWIKRFFSETNAAWQIILSDVLDHYGGALLLKSQYPIKPLDLTNLPPFYIQVLLFWQEMRNYASQEINGTTDTKGSRMER